MVDMNNFGSRAQGFRLYEELKANDDMKYIRSWAQGSRFYEQHIVVDDINDWVVSTGP